MKPDVSENVRQHETLKIRGETIKLPISVEGNRVVGLLDSGANCSLLSEHWYEENLASKGIDLYKNNEYIYDINGNEISIIGHIVANVNLSGINQNNCVFYIKRAEKESRGLGKNTEQDCLIGMNILWTIFEKWGVTKRISNRKGSEDQNSTIDCCMRMVGQNLKLWQEESLGYAYCISKQNRRIPAWSRKVFRIYIEKLKDVQREYVVVEGIKEESKNNLPPGVQVLPSYTVCEWGIGYICIANWNENDVYVESEIAMGEAQLGIEDCRQDTRPCDEVTEEEMRRFRVNLGVNINEDLKEEDLVSLERLLYRYKECFELNDNDLGLIKGCEHQIRLKSEVPIKLPYRRIAPALIPEAKELLKDLKKRGIIEESLSPYAAPIVLVRKKSGGLRLCIDYRKLNQVTHRDAFPLPRITESLDALEGARFFSTFDLAQGYHQILLKEEDREKTAFSVPWGHYQYRRCPMGLTNSPATFQRCMENILGDMVFEFLVIYLDDLILFGKTVEDHLEKMEVLFRRIKSYGIKLKPEKCHFLKTRVNYLGFSISDRGIGPEQSKIQAVENWQRPKTIKEVRGFLGFATFYRRFIKNFAKIAKPLNDLLKGEKKKSSEKIGDKWTEDAELAFQCLKQTLVEAPVLQGIEFGKECILEIDASYDGLGAVLSQYKGKQLHPVAYGSRSLRPHERNMRNYSSRKLELCGLKWAVTEKFKNYLIGTKCIVFTDNAPLSNLSTAKLDHTEQKWVADLAVFDLEIRFKPGKQNVKADALSRQSKENEFSQEENDDDWVAPHEGMNNVVGVISRQDILEWEDVLNKQKTCPVLKTVRRWIEGEDSEEDCTIYKHEVALWKKEKENLILRENILYKIDDDQKGNIRYRLAVPVDLRRKCLREAHDKFAHQGMERTNRLLNTRVYWPNMRAFIIEYIRECDVCLRTKDEMPSKHTMPVHIQASKPLEIVALDFCTVEKSSTGKEHILVASDIFTKYIWAFPTKDQKATTVARLLVDEIFYKFGIPERIHSDQGRNFESKIVREICKRFDVRKSRTSPYHPEGNGQVERMNRTIYGLLRALEEEKRNKWHLYLQSLVFIYNCTPHSVTQFSPYFLFFGRDPCISIDCWGYAEETDDRSVEGEWLERQWAIQRDAWKIAKENCRRNWTIKAKSTLERATPSDLDVGQKVLLRENKIIGRAKLGNKFKKERWIIEEVINKDCGLYKIRPEGYEAKIIHRRNIRPIGNVTEKEPEKSESDSDLTETEMPDMETVLKKFGVDTSRIGQSEDKRESDECQDEELQHKVPEVRRSERLRRKRNS